MTLQHTVRFVSSYHHSIDSHRKCAALWLASANARLMTAAERSDSKIILLWLRLICSTGIYGECDDLQAGAPDIAVAHSSFQGESAGGRRTEHVERQSSYGFIRNESSGDEDHVHIAPVGIHTGLCPDNTTTTAGRSVVIFMRDRQWRALREMALHTQSNVVDGDNATCRVGREAGEKPLKWGSCKILA
jgi:hypothetical protein